MSSEAGKASHLAGLLYLHGEAIAAAWVDVTRRLPHAHYRDRSPSELRAAALRNLDGVARAFSSGSYDPLDDYVAGITPVRLSQGFDIGEVIEGLLPLRESTLPFLSEALPADSLETHEAAAELDAFVRYMTARFGHLYAAAMRRDIQEEQKRTALMLRAV